MNFPSTHTMKYISHLEHDNYFLMRDGFMNMRTRMKKQCCIAKELAVAILCCPEKLVYPSLCSRLTIDLKYNKHVFR